MIKQPDKIYLQINDDLGEELDDITWCEDRIEDTDIEYIRADLVQCYLTGVKEIK